MGGLRLFSPGWVSFRLFLGGRMTVTEMVQPEAGSAVGEFYVRNMRLLWGQDARLAMAIDGVAESRGRRGDEGWGILR